MNYPFPQALQVPMFQCCTLKYGEWGFLVCNIEKLGMGLGTRLI